MSKVTKKELNERLLMVETLLGLHRALPEQISNDQANNAIFRMQCALSSGKELAERNQTEVEQRIEALEEFATYADNMLTELNHALPDPEYDAKCEAEVADVEASLDRHRERLGLNKPQLKQLDQSVFDGLDERWVAASVEENGIVRLYLSNESNPYDCEYHLAGTKYDTTDWQNSLIERDTAKELTGSELCRAMLARGDKFILCGVSDVDDSDAANHESDDFLAEAVTDFDCKDELFGTTSMRWNYAVPINNQGEPLTASEVGL